MSQYLSIGRGERGPASRTAMARRRQRTGVLFALPAILGFLIFTVGPMIASLVFSLTDYNIISAARFVGFENYATLLGGRDPFFYDSVRATLKYVLLSVPANLIYAFGLALFLNREMKMRALFRTIFYFPVIVPAVATSFVWLLMMNPNYGIFNMVLRLLGLPRSQWIFGKDTVIPSIVFMGLFGTGSTMVIFLAGLQNIPRQFYEAVEVDGGNAVHKFLYITLPMITPTLFFNGIMGMIGAFQVFGTAYIMTQGGPGNASLFYVYNLWRTAFTHMQMGLASAEAWLLFVVVVSLSMFVMKTSKHWVYYEGGN